MLTFWRSMRAFLTSSRSFSTSRSPTTTGPDPAERWREVKVYEVWFPWTENPRDAEAKRTPETQARIALALRNSWANGSALTPRDAEIKRRLELMAANPLSNEKAMSMLHGGIRSKPQPRYLFAESADGTLVDSSDLPGVR